jgi:hypothetical protein
LRLPFSSTPCCSLAFSLLAAALVPAAFSEPAAAATAAGPPVAAQVFLSGIPVDFILLALTLIGVALPAPHAHTTTGNAT